MTHGPHGRGSAVDYRLDRANGWSIATGRYRTCSNGRPRPPPRRFTYATWSWAGPNLAAEAFRAGLVDECRVFLAPVLVGGGTRALPEGLHRSLELLDERWFPTGFAYLGYRVAG
jgi:RibD C-terminal domain